MNMQSKTTNKKLDALSIIIVGCGKVGRTLVEQLSQEGHDITIVDRTGRRHRRWPTSMILWVSRAPAPVTVC